MLPDYIRDNYVHVAGTGTYLRPDETQVGFEIRGRKVVVPSGDVQDTFTGTKAAMFINQDRSKALRVQGTLEFRRQAWLMGSKMGVEIKGYKHTAADLLVLTNMIAADQEAYRQAQQAAQQSSETTQARQNTSENQPRASTNAAQPSRTAAAETGAGTGVVAGSGGGASAPPSTPIPGTPSTVPASAAHAAPTPTVPATAPVPSAPSATPIASAPSTPPSASSSSATVPGTNGTTPPAIPTPIPTASPSAPSAASAAVPTASATVASTAASPPSTSPAPAASMAAPVPGVPTAFNSAGVSGAGFLNEDDKPNPPKTKMPHHIKEAILKRIEGKPPEEALAVLSGITGWDTRPLPGPQYKARPQKAPSPSQAWRFAQDLGRAEEFSFLNPDVSGTAKKKRLDNPAANPSTLEAGLATAQIQVPSALQSAAGQNDTPPAPDTASFRAATVANYESMKAAAAKPAGAALTTGTTANADTRGYGTGHNPF